VNASRTKFAPVLLSAMACVVTSSRAEAQEVSLSRYEVPAAGDRFFAVLGPNVDGHLVPRGQLTVGYEHRPFVLKDSAGNVLAAPSSRRLFVHGSASLAILDRLLVSVDAPFAAAQGGDIVDFGGGRELVPTQGPALGEVRLGVRGRLYGAPTAPFQLGVGGFVYLPTATDPWSGEGYVHGQPTLQLGGQASVLRYNAHAGARIRPSQDPITVTFAAALGVSLLGDTLTFGPEFFGSYDLTKGKPIDGLLEFGSVFAAEALGGVQYRFLERFVVGAAAGSSFTTAVGSPELRGLVRFAYSPPPGPPPPPPPVDTDKDGFFDPVDACPKVAGIASSDPKKKGCPPPPPDDDGDGVADKDDACPAMVGGANPDRKKNGCPPDSDGDGLFDPEDACPKDVGAKDLKGPDRGCPDKDGDGIVDKSDACVDVFGFENAEASTRGCPRAVVTEKEIVINQRVEFETDKAVVLPESEPLLEAVAKLLEEHPEITLLEVGGHTDELGDAMKNLNLSQSRARAVSTALAQRRIASNRLAARGYGSTRPLVKEKTPEALQKNRRVEFRILLKNNALLKKK
jgi:OOP family OmpA-OmpF porin